MNQEVKAKKLFSLPFKKKADKSEKPVKKNPKQYVDFDRLSAKERWMIRLKSASFIFRFVWALVRYVLLIGISYVVIFPFISKIFGSFMSPDDLVDVSVKLIPKYPTLDIYKAIITENYYFYAFTNTLLLSLSSAIIQMFTCSFIGYGLAKFKFRGHSLLFFLVVFTMVVPHETLQLSMFMKFRYFDIYGIYGFVMEKFVWLREALGVKYPYMNLINTFWPMLILSFGGLAFKNGLYIFIMRQFFKGVPDELEEAAYMDGSGPIKTFWKIVLPISRPMMITIFLFSFAWQWTDTFYTKMFFTSQGLYLMPDIVNVPDILNDPTFVAQNLYSSAITNTCGLMIIIPLIVVYCFCQRYLVEGIERSGIVG